MMGPKSNLMAFLGSNQGPNLGGFNNYEANRSQSFLKANQPQSKKATTGLGASYLNFKLDLMNLYYSQFF